jgi:hypothetical protein
MVTNIIETIVDVITGLLSGIGQAVAQYFQTLVLVESATPGEYTDALNPFGIFLFVLLGIGAAFGLATLVFNLVRNRA